MEATISILIMAVVGIFLIVMLKNVINIAGGIWAAYLLLADDNLWGGILVIGFLITLNSILPDKKGKNNAATKVKKGREDKYRDRKGRRGTDVWLWLVPVLWPVLILKTFFRDRQVYEPKPEDYEHYLRCNGR